MRQDQLQSAYNEFFFKSDAGQYFINYIESFIDKEHQKAEKSAKEARDFTQSAKGAREILNHIQTTITVIKKGKMQ